MYTVKIVLASLLALVLLVGIGVAGWQFEWWLAEKNTDRRVGIENRNTGTQTAWRDEVENLIIDIETLGEDTPASQAMIHRACSLSGRLTNTYRTESIETFTIVYCT